MKRQSTLQISITETDADRLALMLRAQQRRLTRPRTLPLLLKKLDGAEFHSSITIPKNVVTMNSRILLRDLDSGAELIATSTYPHGANPDRGRISVLTPIGTALLGLKANSVVEFSTSEGQKRYQIKRIIYQPEAAKEDDA
jgi:regulator of nucleoside diphosphate kinase